jgi:hypothetical protein
MYFVGKAQLQDAFLQMVNIFTSDILTDGLMLQELKYIIDDSPETIQEKKKRQNWVFSLLHTGPKHIKTTLNVVSKSFFGVIFQAKKLGIPTVLRLGTAVLASCYKLSASCRSNHEKDDPYEHR